MYQAPKTADEKIEDALDYLRRRYEERDGFISDDDVLDAADYVAPFDWDAAEAGDLDAMLARAERCYIGDRLFEMLTEADEETTR